MKNKFLLGALALLMTAGCATSNSQNIREKKGDIYLTAGTEALSSGNFTEALASLQEAVRLIPDSAAAWTNLGIAYSSKDQDAKAEECLKRAIQVDSKWTDARANLGALYLKMKRNKEAEKQLKEALNDLIYPHPAMLHYNLSLIYSEWRKPLLAEQQLKLALQADENHCAAWYRLGMIQKERNEIGHAISSITKSVAGTCFGNPQAHFEISSLYLKLREVAQAKSKLLDIIQLFPQSDWAKKAEVTLNLIR